jgi:hypothetical protein
MTRIVWIRPSSPSCAKSPPSVVDLAALLQESAAVAHKTGALATKDLERVAVDTTCRRRRSRIRPMPGSPTRSHRLAWWVRDARRPPLAGSGTPSVRVSAKPAWGGATFSLSMRRPFQRSSKPTCAPWRNPLARMGCQPPAAERPDQIAPQAQLLVFVAHGLFSFFPLTARRATGSHPSQFEVTAHSACC